MMMVLRLRRTESAVPVVASACSKNKSDSACSADRVSPSRSSLSTHSKITQPTVEIGECVSVHGLTISYAANVRGLMNANATLTAQAALAGASSGGLLPAVTFRLVMGRIPNLLRSLIDPIPD